MRKFLLKTFALLMLASPSLADARPVETQFIPVDYQCERGIKLPMIFVNDTQGRSNVIATIDGKLLRLSQVVSASGARYRNQDETAASYEVWNKGDKARITYGTVNNSSVLYQECQESPKPSDDAN